MMGERPLMKMGYGSSMIWWSFLHTCWSKLAQKNCPTGLKFRIHSSLELGMAVDSTAMK